MGTIEKHDVALYVGPVAMRGALSSDGQELRFDSGLSWTKSWRALVLAVTIQ